MTTATTNKTATAEQIAACERITENGQTWYQVASATSDRKYVVRAIRKEGRYYLVCDCLAGVHGNQCWHRRAAAAHAAQVKAEAVIAEELAAKLDRVDTLMEMGLTRDEAWTAVEAVCIVNGKPADNQTLVNVFGPSTRRPTESEIARDAKRFAGRGFSLYL